ncbi:MAG: hypothetical protein COV44_05530 [Deltaproteobacteria bacterium CG11_big_fil_rev_8_21_14_0_20_45_16]|nr:MAG: hypothetical protein COV44_05530 [Deltaproteobacteria bacterium CG11_big_fil_rev_8_21_14_0_20_45_16]
MKRFYHEGEKSNGICKSCRTEVTTTFKSTTLALASGKGKVQGVLAAVCDDCGKVVAVPQQSAPRIREALFGKKLSVEVRVPRHLRDVLLTICSEITSDCKPTEIEPFVLRYYMAHIAHGRIQIRSLKKHLKSKLLQGRANDRLSFRVSEEVLRKFEKKIETVKLNRTDAIKMLILQAKVDLLDKAAPGRLKEIVLFASAA